MGLSRLALWAQLSGVSIVEPLLTTAYEREAQREWLDGSGESPHGAPWHSSFHASAFPGEDPLACGRLAVYGLMGLPDPEPIAPRLRAIFDVGKDLELHWVRRLGMDGLLLSADQTAGEEFQTGFADREHWLTGASDAIILPPFWRKGSCVEVKTTSHDKVTAMRNDPASTPYSHAKYVRQLKTYISLANEAPFTPTVTVCRESWAITREVVDDVRWCPVHQNVGCETETFQVEAPDDGTLIYSSREEPLTTASYYFGLDEEHMVAGRAKLVEYRDAFLADVLPPHPRETERAKWSVPPCQYCLDPGSLVLTSDLHWVLAQSLVPGDELIGFDEQIATGSKGVSAQYRPAIVEHTEVIRRPRVVVRTDLGPTCCSVDHQFLVRYRDGRRWIRAEDLVIGDKIVALGKPWLVQVTHGSGYLAALFDGEGSVSRGGHVSVAQNEGPVLERAKSLLAEHGFTFGTGPVTGAKRHGTKTCMRLRVNGGLYEQLRFIGSIRPLRLLSASSILWDGKSTGRQTLHAVVTAVEPLGTGPVIALATSTKTLVADGLLSHNCNRKKPCKLDYQGKVTKISESNQIAAAKAIRPDYDYAANRAVVLKRWGVEQ